MKFKSLVISVIVALVVTLVPSTSFATEGPAAPAEEAKSTTIGQGTEVDPEEIGIVGTFNPDTSYDDEEPAEEVKSETTGQETEADSEKTAEVVTLDQVKSFGEEEPAEEVNSETTEPVEKAATKKTAKVVKLKSAKLRTIMKSTKNVVVRWSKVKNARGYVVYETNPRGTKLTKVKSVKATKKRIYRAKVKPGKAEYYIVKAYGKSTKAKKVKASMSKVLKVKTPKRLTPNSKAYKQTNAYKIIKAARGKLGKAYVSGAAGPNSFDCSGYVYYIMNKTKAAEKIKTKKFSRSSAQGEYSQLRKYNIGSKSLSKAQPGDIVFFSRTASTGNIHHVGIYYGNGKIIHASEPRTGVIISPKQHRKVAAIVRLPQL